MILLCVLWRVPTYRAGTPDFYGVYRMLNREMKREALSKMSYEDRVKYLRAEQDVVKAKANLIKERAVHDKFRKRYEEYVVKNAPRWALWVAKRVPPKWYERMFFVFADNMPPKRLMEWVSNIKMPKAFTLLIFIFFKMPMMVIAIVVCSVFLKPLIWLKETMTDFGISARAYRDINTSSLVLIIKQWKFGDRGVDPDWYLFKNREVARFEERI